MKKTLIAIALLAALAVSAHAQVVGPPQYVEQAGSYANITSATTTVVKGQPGVLHSVCVNTFAASGTITIYDNTAGSGTKIGTITNPGTLVAEGPHCALYGVVFSTGLTIVTTGVQDITVTYR